MKIIILEGIATSGKTTIKNKLVEFFSEKEISFSVVEENESLMPILDNKNKQVSIDLLRKIIGKSLKKKNDFIIFDRLFFTHIFRTGSSIDDFQEIEDMVKNSSLLVFLKIDESKISERIMNTRKLRGKQWNENVSKKGSDEEIYQYYINQQRLLLGLLEKTSLNSKVYNTTNMDFYECLEDLKTLLLGDYLSSTSKCNTLLK